METYFLIDYENVGEAGLAGCKNLEKTDHILIFFTDNARKIDMSEIANHGSAELIMIKVSAGKQSTDIHIGSYLGYLAGKNCGENIKVNIVSKDSDFDNVISFWNAKSGVKAARVQKITDAAAKKTEQPKQVDTAKKTEQPKPAGTAKATVKAVSKDVSSSERQKLNNEIMKALSAKKYSGETVGKAASLVLSHLGEKNFPAVVKTDLKKKFADAGIYALIAPIIAKYSDIPDPAADRNTINRKIQQILSQAGKPNDVVGHVASIVVKNMGAKSAKQQIYHAIISKYGQKEGLDLYNRIKKDIP